MDHSRRHKLTGQQVATARHSRQPGRQAEQPHRQRGQSPSTVLHAVEERFWRQEPPPPTDMPRDLWLYIQSTRPANTWGEAGATQSLCKAFFCSVQPSCVHDRERPRDSSVSIPAHFARILAPYSRERQVLSQGLRQHYVYTLGIPSI
jgi:hypothetical protein